MHACVHVLVVISFIIDCPEPKFMEVQPQNFTAVEGYSTSLSCSYNGYYMLSVPIQIWVLFPGSHTPVWLNDQPYSDCRCWVENKPACSVGTDPNNCCRFQLIMHSIPHLDDSGTVFSCTGNFTNKDIAWMCK